MDVRDLPILYLAQYQHQEVQSFLAFHSLLLHSQPKENDIFRTVNFCELSPRKIEELIIPLYWAAIRPHLE